jgi:hypothetical protein
LPSCANYNYHCFVDKADGKHYKLDATNVARWTKGIKAGNATIDRPTDALRGYLMRRDNPRKQPSNINQNSTPVQGNIQNHFNITLPDTHSPSSRFVNVSSSPASMIPQKMQSAIHESSPILSDNEPDTEIERYFKYLISKFQKSKDKLKTAQTILENDDMDLKGIHKTDLRYFTDKGITYGLAMKIQRCIKEFQTVTS